MGALLPDALRLGPVELVVSDLDRSVAWYGEAIGLRRFGDGAAVDEPGRAVLGTGGPEPVVVLVEDGSARRAGRHSGLYHVALLHPSRVELARAAVRLAVTRTPIQGASDHGTHEAIYLGDPDGNGLELAADRPRDEWPSYDEQFRDGPQPLDLDALLALVADEPPAPRPAHPGLVVGHVHLHVGDLRRADAFYLDVLGFEKLAELGGSAAFVSAGGYHHHLAYNLWRGAGAPPVPEHVVGLRRWTVVTGDGAAVDAVRERAAAAGVAVGADEDGALLLRDPFGIPVRVVA